MIKCSLCPQTFKSDDPLLDERKKRHEEKHTRGWNNKASKNGGGNNTVGKVKWIEIVEGLEMIELAIIDHDCPTMKKGTICEHGVGSVDKIKALNNRSNASGW